MHTPRLLPQTPQAPNCGSCRIKRRRIASQFEDLQACYRQLRAAVAALPAQEVAPAAAGAGPPAAANNGGVGAVVDEGLSAFSRVLSLLMRFNRLKVSRRASQVQPLLLKRAASCGRQAHRGTWMPREGGRGWEGGGDCSCWLN